MKIGLFPLDERPVNTRYPRMIAQIAGVELFLPPSEALSHFRSPADQVKLSFWLEEVALFGWRLLSESLPPQVADRT